MMHQPEILDSIERRVHSCVFYESGDELLSFQLPFFCRGALDSEVCVWLVRRPLTVEIACREFRALLPDLEQRMASGQVEVLDGETQYGESAFDAERSAAFWDRKAVETYQAGFSGMRISGNIPGPVGPDAWQMLMRYEELTDQVIHQRRIKSLCAYEATHLQIAEILDVANQHEIAFVKRSGQWSFVKNAEYHRALHEQERLADELRQRVKEVEMLMASERYARTEAERANRLKDEFLATISHELRTPLNAMLGWSQLLQSNSGLPASDLAEGLEAITRNANAQRQLIEDLLDLGRINSGKLRLTMHVVRPQDIVRAAVDALAPLAESNGISIRVFDKGSVSSVRGDPERLQQVLGNLLSNAIKFTPAGGHVDVELRRAGDSVEITVRDTGAGIEREFLPFVFDRFAQADASTTRRQRGLGIGLAIVRQLVEMHGGTVSAYSDGPNRGSVFTLSLPFESSGDPSAGTIRRSGTQTREVSLADLKVLTIDDDADAREVVMRILQERNAVVLTAGSMSEALEIIRSRPVDVILCDISMPGGDGYEFIKRAREIFGEERPVPAAAVTAFNRPEDRERALRAGYRAHLAKPIEQAKLVRLVAELGTQSTDVS